jgi:hypothetical protein
LSAFNTPASPATKSLWRFPITGLIVDFVAASAFVQTRCHQKINLAKIAEHCLLHKFLERRPVGTGGGYFAQQVAIMKTTVSLKNAHACIAARCFTLIAPSTINLNKYAQENVKPSFIQALIIMPFKGANFSLRI